jgi:SOS-response transcriptional repressor LexA
VKVCEHCGARLAENDPSPAELRVLNFIVDFREAQGRFPTYREIRIGMRFRSVATANTHVYRLADKGWVTIVKRVGIRAARRAA